MKLKVDKRTFLAAPAVFRPYWGKDADWVKWNKSKDLDIGPMAPAQVNKLIAALEEHPKAHGVPTLLQDCRTWLAAIEGKDVKPRSLRHFAALVTEIIRQAAGHWLYEKDKRDDTYQAWYIYSVSYTPPKQGHYGESRPYTTIKGAQMLFGKIKTCSWVFHTEDALYMYPVEALAREDLFVQTAELRAIYDEDTARYEEMFDKVGLLCLGRGVATDDLDGNPSRSSSWWYSRVNTIRLDHYGEPTRVLIDVFREDDKEENDRNEDKHITGNFWKRKKFTVEDDDADDDETELEDPDEAAEEVVLPIHPLLACFDLRRHLRLKVHVHCLEVYIRPPSLREYDHELGKKLVLPEDVRDLVNMLLSNKGEGGFKDIVGHKGVGAIILTCGPPGTGKTLTAEVYSEVMGRPLYTVQASQLGTDPDDLEDNLLKIFARAARWNAICLLDEADVYVRSRGDDLQQNAIVGVFLRVLEYYNGVLFMTTNRSDLVDDAIASRCIARIDYKTPEVRDQAKIWAILARGADIKLPAKTIAEIVHAHPHLSGRDIKNLLKLGHLVSLSKGEPLTKETIDFVKKFKPTKTGEPVTDMERALDELLATAERAQRSL
ncbi:MAG: AAA family ATPase [Acidimicrobiia bacterium]